jgi:hypothetical protein
MILILGWLTVLVFVVLAVLSGLPEYVRRIDNEILEKHRKSVEPEPGERRLRRVK